MNAAISKAYAKALFLLADSKDEKLKRWKRELEEVLHIFEKFPKLNSFFTVAVIKDKEKEKFLEKVFKGKIDEELYQFLLFLLKKKFLVQLEDIASSYATIVKEHFNILEVHMVSSSPMDEEAKKILLEKLGSAYGKRVDIVEKVDPKLLGGFILKIGDQFIDASIKGRLVELNQKLLSLHF